MMEVVKQLPRMLFLNLWMALCSPKPNLKVNFNLYAIKSDFYLIKGYQSWFFWFWAIKVEFYLVLVHLRLIFKWFKATKVDFFGFSPPNFDFFRPPKMLEWFLDWKFFESSMSLQQLPSLMVLTKRYRHRLSPIYAKPWIPVLTSGGMRFSYVKNCA